MGLLGEDPVERQHRENNRIDRMQVNIKNAERAANCLFKRTLQSHDPRITVCKDRIMTATSREMKQSSVNKSIIKKSEKDNIKKQRYNAIAARDVIAEDCGAVP